VGAIVGPVKLAVLGAGLIGKRHIEYVVAADAAALVAVVDPLPAAEMLARQSGCRWFPDFAGMMQSETPDGVIVATPNQLHVTHALACVSAGLPVLVEKPITDDVASATMLVEAAERAGVPLLVGHHKRHNPLVREAKRAIDEGRLGDIVAAHGSCWFYKPPEYFDTSWRREKGAGPVFINLIHDVDLFRYLLGEVVSVQALESNARRGYPVEDSAAVLLRFASGALATLSVSDTIVAPWSWELTSGENAAFAQTPESCYMIGGTRGSLTIPHLDVWFNPTRPSWLEPLSRERLPVDARDPLALQIDNLCAVIRGTAEPVVSGREGLETLRVIAAVKEAARTGRVVTVA
jgi:predicted dehydrogenase